MPGEQGQVLTVRRCAVLGSPIEHSLSPAIHSAAYAYLGLDWVYERHEVTADQLSGVVSGLDETWRGLSCTMPLKEAVVALGEPDEIVARLGVGNTLVFDGRPGDRSSTRVYNTDVLGLEAALRGAGADGAARALIVGNGATARSALLALARLDVRDVVVLARDRTKTRLLDGLCVGGVVEHRDFGAPLDAFDIVVSTVPAGAQSGLAEDIARAGQIVFDAVYDPWPTPLAAAAQSLRRVVLNGLDLLAWQAVFQVELFTGRTPPVAVLLSAAHEALAARS